METQAPIIAFLYDFDKTLCTTDMEDYAFIPSLGYTPAEFWGRANAYGWENRMDGLLAYMYTMIQECAAQNIKLDRAFLNHCGESIQLFPGVREWFARINAFGESLGVQVEHYVISSGLREIIEGSGIAQEFREIYACEFYYNENGDACWPKLDVNFTNKTQFVYRINKGILDVSRDRELNDSMPDDSKRVPLIYREADVVNCFQVADMPFEYAFSDRKPCLQMPDLKNSLLCLLVHSVHLRIFVEANAPNLVSRCDFIHRNVGGAAGLGAEFTAVGKLAAGAKLRGIGRRAWNCLKPFAVCHTEHRHGAHQRPRVRMTAVVEYILQRSVLYDPSHIHHAYLVRHLCDKSHVVCD